MFLMKDITICLSLSPIVMSEQSCIDGINKFTNKLIEKHGYSGGAFLHGPNSHPKRFGTEEMKAFFAIHEAQLLQFRPPPPPLEPQELEVLPANWTKLGIGFHRRTIRSAVKFLLGVEVPQYKKTIKPPFWPEQYEWRHVGSGWNIKELEAIVRHIYEYVDNNGSSPIRIERHHTQSPRANVSPISVRGRRIRSRTTTPRRRRSRSRTPASNESTTTPEANDFRLARRRRSQSRTPASIESTTPHVTRRRRIISPANMSHRTVFHLSKFILIKQMLQC